MNGAEAHPGASANADLPFGFDPLSRVFRSDPCAITTLLRSG